MSQQALDLRTSVQTVWRAVDADCGDVLAAGGVT